VLQQFVTYRYIYMRQALISYQEARSAIEQIFTVRCYAERGYEIANLQLHVICPSVCPSVRPSVAFRYRDHIGWNTSKIISRRIA